MTLLSQPLIRPPLRIAAPSESTVVMEGVLREPDAEEWFRPLVDQMHRRAVTLGLSEVVLDLRRLEYANAAAWKCFVYWLRQLHLDPKATYNIRIRANETHRWQRVGMPSLAVFGRERLIVDMRGSPGGSSAPPAL